MNRPADQLPGTYRLADGTHVEFSEAIATWVPIAYDYLIATARRYRAVTTYTELSEHVQDISGIRTRVLLTNWIGKLLEVVALRAKSNGEPPLTSLCVRQNGTMGPGYERAPKAIQDEPGEDIEMYAARHRLLCYRKFAGDLPVDGGEPGLTVAESERRARKALENQAASSQAVCPRCNLVLLPSGRCGNCA